jgi:hypothetical protein
MLGIPAPRDSAMMMPSYRKSACRDQKVNLR